MSPFLSVILIFSRFQIFSLSKREINRVRERIMAPRSEEEEGLGDVGESGGWAQGLSKGRKSGILYVQEVV